MIDKDVKGFKFRDDKIGKNKIVRIHLTTTTFPDDSFGQITVLREVAKDYYIS